ncbi:MAG: hypothetical protein Q8R39_03020 [bacterium]|nr:hypothetical protein [bacterium]MDZ4285128.1 hypothetical protein [Patescibacteria group bacterium]
MHNTKPSSALLQRVVATYAKKGRGTRADGPRSGLMSAEIFDKNYIAHAEGLDGSLEIRPGCYYQSLVVDGYRDLAGAYNRVGCYDENCFSVRTTKMEWCLVHPELFSRNLEDAQAFVFLLLAENIVLVVGVHHDRQPILKLRLCGSDNSFKRLKNDRSFRTKAMLRCGLTRDINFLEQIWHGLSSFSKRGWEQTGLSAT